MGHPAQRDRRFNSESIHEVLEALLHSSLSGQPIVVPLVLDESMSLAHTHPGIAPPSGISKHLLVVGGRLNLNDLVTAADEPLAMRVSVFVRSACASRRCDSSSMSLADFMCELGRWKDLLWVCRGRIFALAMFVEASMKSNGLALFPIGYPTAVGRRIDRTLADHFVMGKGVDQIATPSVFIEAHTRSDLALCRANKLKPRATRPTTMNVNNALEHQMMR